MFASKEHTMKGSFALRRDASSVLFGAQREGSSVILCRQMSDLAPDAEWRNSLQRWMLRHDEFRSVVLPYLTVHDICNLCCCCSEFQKYFSSNEVWEMMFLRDLSEVVIPVRPRAPFPNFFHNSRYFFEVISVVDNGQELVVVDPDEEVIPLGNKLNLKLALKHSTVCDDPRQLPKEDLAHCVMEGWVHRDVARAKHLAESVAKLAEATNKKIAPPPKCGASDAGTAEGVVDGETQSADSSSASEALIAGGDSTSSFADLWAPGVVRYCYNAAYVCVHFPYVAQQFISSADALKLLTQSTAAQLVLMVDDSELSATAYNVMDALSQPTTHDESISENVRVPAAVSEMRWRLKTNALMISAVLYWRRQFTVSAFLAGAFGVACFTAFNLNGASWYERWVGVNFLTPNIDLCRTWSDFVGGSAPRLLSLATVRPVAGFMDVLPSLAALLGGIARVGLVAWPIPLFLRRAFQRSKVCPLRDLPNAIQAHLFLSSGVMAFDKCLIQLPVCKLFLRAALPESARKWESPILLGITIATEVFRHDHGRYFTDGREEYAGGQHHRKLEAIGIAFCGVADAFTGPVVAALWRFAFLTSFFPLPH